MKKGTFIFIADDFYKKYDLNGNLMQNKGKSHNRPCFYAFPDKVEPNIFWCIPISSKVKKYEEIVLKKILNQKAKGNKNPKCNTICFGEVLGQRRAFLIQNMFPVIAKYVTSIYIDNNTNKPVTIASKSEKEIVKNAKEILKLVFCGYDRLVFFNVNKTYNELIEEIGVVEMTMETKRLLLRKWKESDAESLFEYAKDPDVGPIAGWPPHKSIEESLGVINNVLNGKECYCICEKGTDKAIGAVELILNGHSHLTKRDDECELGYWIGKPFWGKGYMPEAAEALIVRGFNELGISTIWCAYYDGNVKSKRVQEKLGFKFHHTDNNVKVPLLGEVRIGHTNYMTKEMFGKRKK